jgi:hypothetical protein
MSQRVTNTSNTLQRAGRGGVRQARETHHDLRDGAVDRAGRREKRHAAAAQEGFQQEEERGEAGEASPRSLTMAGRGGQRGGDNRKENDGGGPANERGGAAGGLLQAQREGRAPAGHADMFDAYGMLMHEPECTSQQPVRPNKALEQRGLPHPPLLQTEVLRPTTEVLQTGGRGGRRMELEIDVAAVAFHEHPLFCVEDKLYADLRLMHGEYRRRLHANQLEHMSLHLAALQQAWREAGTGEGERGGERHGGFDSAAEQAQAKAQLRRAFLETLSSKVTEENDMARLTASLYAKWQQLVQERARTKSVSTPAKLTARLWSQPGAERRRSSEQMEFAKGPLLGTITEELSALRETVEQGEAAEQERRRRRQEAGGAGGGGGGGARGRHDEDEESRSDSRSAGGSENGDGQGGKKMSAAAAAAAEARLVEQRARLKRLEELEFKTQELLQLAQATRAFHAAQEVDIEGNGAGGSGSDSGSDSDGDRRRRRGGKGKGRSKGKGKGGGGGGGGGGELGGTGRYALRAARRRPQQPLTPHRLQALVLTRPLTANVTSAPTPPNRQVRAAAQRRDRLPQRRGRGGERAGGGRPQSRPPIAH